MTTLRAILIDDENHCVETLRYELSRNCPEVEVIASCSSGTEGLVALNRHQVDLLFLDIEMPGMNGFEMLKRCGAVEFDVIFVTAYDHYALQAFRFAAIDYLLKPVLGPDLRDAVARVMAKRDKVISRAQLEALLDNIRPTGPKRIALPVQHGLDFVAVDEILRCMSDSNYTHVFLSDGRKFLLSRTLKELEEMLTPYGFFRCHQSHLIRLADVKRYVKTDGGYLELIDGTKIPVAKRKREACLALLKS